MTSRSMSSYAAFHTVTILGVAALQTSWAQEPQNSPRIVYEQRMDPNGRQQTLARVVGAGGDDWTAGVQQNLKVEIRKAAEALRDAKDEEAKNKTKEHLRELLRNYFGEDMVRRDKELEAMENRLKKLKEQLARRRDKMNEILDLQAKVLVNEADGLGFYSNDPSNNPFAAAHSYFYDSVPSPAYPAIQPSVPTLSAQPPSVMRPMRVAPVTPPTAPVVPVAPSATTPPAPTATSPAETLEAPGPEEPVGGPSSTRSR